MKAMQDLTRLITTYEQKMYIDGEWVAARMGKTFSVRNPTTGEAVASVPDGDASDARIAIDAASSAFSDWSGTPPNERAAILIKVRDLILERSEDFAKIIAIEEGKPIRESRMEIRYSAEFITFYAEECKRISGEIFSSNLRDRRYYAIKQPVGVAGIITIWNYPSAGITRPVIPALAAGCTVVVKPPEQTPLSAIAIFKLFEEAGIPRGVANLVTTMNPDVVGKEFLSNPKVRKVSFTGSVEVGKKIMRRASEDLKRVTLELGGHAPFIVYEDAKIELAASHAVASKFQNTGQTCVALNRIYVHESIAKEFTEAFVGLVKKLRIGDPLDETVDVGPLIDKEGMEKVEAHIQDALDKGANLLFGGHRRTDGAFEKGLFFEPTVLSQVNHDMLIMKEETFGPIAPIVTFESDEEVLSYANGSGYGLAAFFYTLDIKRAILMAETLEFGFIGINNPRLGAVHIPFGGLKQSGIGKEGGRLGLEEFLETKLISIGI
jgi:succinate-semialdehyde dehydrogenase/glutarate-semialdehyde dehydrogenase